MNQIAAIGITNQRETTFVWERESGRPIHNAIVWQCRRTEKICRALKADGHEELVKTRTGLLLDPYFSATKLGWILDTHQARAKASEGKLAFGTVDTYLVWRLTAGQVHVSDVSNGARTAIDEPRISMLGRRSPRALRCASSSAPQAGRQRPNS